MSRMHLIGLDIGFSATRRTNALAAIQNGEIRVVKLSVSERDEGFSDCATWT